LTLINHDMIQIREQLDRIEQEIKNPPAPPVDNTNWVIEKL